MKINIITCHDVYNYGASLQAFALQHYLEQMGNDTHIIDYKPEYQQAYKLKVTASEDSPYYQLYKKYPFITWVKAIKNYFGSRKTIGRKRKFHDFNKQYLKLTKKYISQKELTLDPPIADMYIAGSDQIWSTRMKNGTDPSFYLQFGPLSTKRISYAASFGSANIMNGNEVLVKSFLSNFDSISVRETSGVSLLNQLGRNGIQVLDPVFLLSAKEWLNAFNITSQKRLISNHYILVYDLHNRAKGIREKVLELKETTGLRVVAVNDKHETSYADININNAGPIEFLNLISNAEYVVANSFHATAFSVIFNKPFWSYLSNKSISRLTDFLALLGLQERLNNNDTCKEIDWKYVNSQVESLINISKNFLRQNNTINKS